MGRHSHWHGVAHLLVAHVSVALKDSHTRWDVKAFWPQLWEFDVHESLSAWSGCPRLAGVPHVGRLYGSALP
jgi:hypothetical protein